MFGILFESMVHLAETDRLAEAPAHVPALVTAIDRVPARTASRRVKLGIVTPGAHAASARARAVGGDGDLRRRRRDRAGSRAARLPPLHVQRARRGPGRRRRAVRGGRYCDPLATFGALGAHTTTIRFAAHVLVLGYHHPLAIAKRYGTLDVVTGGRVILGVGVGSLQEEFELLGAPFDDRGARADDAMRALRAVALAAASPSITATYYDFEGFLVDPCAVQARVPIWVGGRTYRSLRRAVELGDGWAPFGLRTAELARDAAARRDTEAWAARTTPIDVILQNEHPLDPARRTRPRRRTARDASPTSARPASTSASCTTPPRTTASSSPPSPPRAETRRANPRNSCRTVSAQRCKPRNS